MADAKKDTVAHEEPSKILPREIETEMKESYLSYAMSVIISRALPDVRDGMKPGQRRVVFTMHELNLGPRSQHKKCAKVVGECMGNYHPHGDDPIYGTLVRLAQGFSSRYLLADGHGNFGSIAEPSPAAMRYTEVRMAQAAVDMVEDIDRETVDMVPNYDESRLEPTVLPGKFPNLICNGAQGIAVGMATSIPPHNLNEIADAICLLIDRPTVRDEEILQIVPGPDFPTGGVILGVNAIKQAYLTGRGNLTVRGVAEVETKGDRSTITIKEMPYQVTTELFTEKLIEAVKGERIQGIATVKDRTKVDPNIQIELKRGEDPNVVLNQLYKYTPLQGSFSVILLALDKGRPRTFTLREMLVAFKDHRFEVIRRRTTYLLKKALERIHILEGLRKALDAIDDVVNIIRKSPDTDTARGALMKRLTITERQADAILDMRLARLTGLEQKKLDEELGGLRKEATDYRDILARDERVNGIIKAELVEMKKKYGDERRTKIEAGEAEEIDIESLIKEETVIVTVSHEGYVKRSPIDTYRSQHRGGKGVTGAATKEGDFVERVFTASTHDYLLCFTDKGRVFWLKVYAIPEMSRTARGRALPNLIRLLPNEVVNEIVAVTGEFDETRELVMATSKGVIKKTKLSMFKNPKKTGIVAIKLDDGDKLIGVRITDGKRELGIATKAGQAIRFSEEKLRSMGRNARGVRGMSLAPEDEVRSVVVVGEDGPTLLTVCERGYGKRTPIEDYRITNRGGKGIINIKTTERNGKVVAVVAVRDDDEVILVTSSGKLIRTRCTDIPSIGRNTQGVRLIRVDEGEKVVAVARVVKGEEAGEVATPVESLDAAAIEAAKKADAAEKIEDGPAPTDDGEDGGEDEGGD